MFIKSAVRVFLGQKHVSVSCKFSKKDITEFAGNLLDYFHQNSLDNFTPFRVCVYHNIAEAAEFVNNQIAKALPEIPIDFIRQNSFTDGVIVIQLWLIQDHHLEVKRSSSVNYLSSPQVKWLVVSPSLYKPADDIGYQYRTLFSEIMVENQFWFSNIYPVRFWIYINSILPVDGMADNYQQINSARISAFNFHHIPPVKKRPERYVPASTGIGTSGDHIVLSSLSVISPFVRIESLENDLQTSAFDYPDKVSKNPPLFSRAVQIIHDSEIMLLISGTASIINHSSVYSGDIQRQLRQTLLNLANLINSAFHNPVIDEWNPSVFEIISSSALQLVVYIKRHGDFDYVKSFIDNNISERVDVICLIADVCREELLVEIEGIAFLSKETMI